MPKTKKQFPLEEFKAYLRFKNIPYKELSKKLNVTVSTISDKINNKNNREFSQHELCKISKYLRLSNEEILQYFFPNDLRNAI